MFKIMKCDHPCSVQAVPMEYAKQFERQAMSNHMQTITRLNERGGLDPVEFYLVANGLPLSYSFQKKRLHILKQLNGSRKNLDY